MIFNLICASHNDEILNANLAQSLFFKMRRASYIEIIKGQTNVALAYNVNSRLWPYADYNIYAHHDLYLPADFEYNLIKAINNINKTDPDWGVLGVAGATIINGERKFYGHIRDRGHEWKQGIIPMIVQTLDELLLITKGDFIFDEQFDLHFYGADICCQAIEMGRKNYVIDAYVHHNSTLPIGYRSESFRECERKFRNKWLGSTPIATTCCIVR